MAAVTISGMLDAEAAALAGGWTEERLLNLAGERLGRALGRFFPQAGTIVGYLGKGHNAGDALVALKILRDEFAWKIAIRNAFPLGEGADLTHGKWLELGAADVLEQRPETCDPARPLVLLDGLLGSGSKGEMREPLRTLAAEMKWLRQNAGAHVAAVDLPSGIDADTGHGFPGCVRADVTFMIGNAKRGLLTGHAADFVGALALVPVEALMSKQGGDMDLIAPQVMEMAKARRPFDFHKGLAGRVCLFAGSNAYSGAAVLAATGALRAGAGLITLCVPASAAALVSGKCPPEIIVRGISSPDEIQAENFDSLVVGCGLGEMNDSTADRLFALIAGSPVPVVIDADALNLIARHGRTDILTNRHVLTPHPGEFKRLAPDLAGLPREEAAAAFADRFPATLLLKGSRTIISAKGQPLWCNSTGSPGMASGGQGDLLAGVIGARLANGDAPHEAAALSAWLCGRGAEIALSGGRISEESLTASDVAEHLGAAFLDWRCACR